MCRNLRTKRPRPAFTLIELLVVIAIIGILVVLTVGAVMKVTGGQRLSNTRTAMSTINKTLREHWAYVVAEARKETLSSGGSSPLANINTYFFGGAGDPSGGELSRVIWIKMRLMEAFPVTFNEISNSGTYLFPYKNNIIPPNARRNISTYANTLGGRTADNKGGITESSACLAMALAVMRNGTSLNIDNMGSSNIADSDNDGVKEFVDGWGNPLAFYRFPTDNSKLQNSNPNTKAPANPYVLGDVNYLATSKYADPLDPGGVLFNWQGSGRALFEPSASSPNVHKIAFNKNAACYIMPTIVSWGPNGNINPVIPPTQPPGRTAPFFGLGLIPNTMAIVNNAAQPGSTDEEADNLYSFQLP